jgi:CRISPR/Cas system-associated endonuclease Cas3-HD
MGKSQIRAIRVPLTEEQKELIRSTANIEIKEVVFAALISHDEPLENELDSEADRELAEVIWQGTDDFKRNISNAPEVKAAFEKYAGHLLDDIDPESPMIVLLR